VELKNVFGAHFDGGEAFFNPGASSLWQPPSVRAKAGARSRSKHGRSFFRSPLEKSFRSAFPIGCPSVEPPINQSKLSAVHGFSVAEKKRPDHVPGLGTHSLLGIRGGVHLL
jgi:hypothetical protein